MESGRAHPWDATGRATIDEAELLEGVEAYLKAIRFKLYEPNICLPIDPGPYLCGTWDIAAAKSRKQERS